MTTDPCPADLSPPPRAVQLLREFAERRGEMRSVVESEREFLAMKCAFDLIQEFIRLLAVLRSLLKDLSQEKMRRARAFAALLYVRHYLNQMGLGESEVQIFRELAEGLADLEQGRTPAIFRPAPAQWDESGNRKPGHKGSRLSEIRAYATASAMVDVIAMYRPGTTEETALTRVWHYIGREDAPSNTPGALKSKRKKVRAHEWPEARQIYDLALSVAAKMQKHGASLEEVLDALVPFARKSS